MPIVSNMYSALKNFKIVDPTLKVLNKIIKKEKKTYLQTTMVQNLGKTEVEDIVGTNSKF